MTDQGKYDVITEKIKRRAPAMLAGKAMGAAPSIEEAFFLSALIEEETRALDLPPHWYLGFMLKAFDAQEAKTRPTNARRAAGAIRPPTSATPATQLSPGLLPVRRSK